MPEPKTLSEARRAVFWGVDFSVSSASIGWSANGGHGVHRVTWATDLSGGTRLNAAYKAMAKGAWELCQSGLAAVFVYWEQPSGIGGGLALKYMCGSLQAGVSESLDAWWERPVDTRTCTSGQWKKEVVAADGFAPNGAFGKPKKNDDPETYPALQWARAHGYEYAGPGMIDDADGICISEYAERQVSFH